MNPLQALYERARQEWEASDKDTIPNPLAGAGLGPAQVGYNPARDVPVIGGLINRTVNGPLHALGLINEGAGNVAQGIGGGAMLLAALAQVKAADAGMVDPNNTATQAARLALAQGFAHPGRALEAAREGPDTTDAWLAGALEMAANPLNYAGGVGEFGRGVEAGAPLAGRAIRALAHTGHAANELPVSPIRALLAAKRADQGERAAAAGAAVLRALLGREAPAADAGGAVARLLADVPVETSGGVPLAGAPKVPVNLPTQLPLEAAPKPPPVQIPLRIERDVPLPPRATLADLLPREAVTPAEEAAAQVAAPRTRATVEAEMQAARARSSALLDAGDHDGAKSEGLRAIALRQELASLSVEDSPALSNVDIAKPNSELRNTESLTAPADPAERAAWQARYVGQSQAGTDILAAGDQVGGGDLTQADLNALSPQERMAALRKLAGGGDLAAGGGGVGLLPTRGGLGAANRAVAGAATGALAGGAAGAATDEDDRLGGAAQGALAGAVLGGNVGAASPELARVTRQLAAASQGTMRSPTMYARAWRAGLQGQAEAAQAPGPQGLGGFVKALPAQWRSSVVMTFKQIPQDAITRWVTLWGIAKKEMKVNDADMARYQELLAGDRDQAVSSLANPVVAILRRVGKADLLEPARFHEVYGTDYLGAEGTRRATMNRGQSTAAGAIFGAFNGLRQVNPLSVAAGAVKGRYQPFINGFVQFLNGVQHDAFRYAMAEKTLARDIPPLSQALIADLQARGVNVAPLVAKGDYFSGADVAAVAGPAIGGRWDTLVEETIRNGGDRVAFLAGDFRDKAMLPGEKALAAVFPFVRWPLHYGPVFAEIAANHPRLAAVAVGILANQREQAKAVGSKAYEAATTPITTEAPVLGGLARLRLGGQKGVLRAGLLGAVVPYANLAGGVDMPPEDASLYEKATAVGDAVGFSPNPLIQAGAYATGLDYRAPGALSRTAGLEGAAGLLPGPLGRLSMPAPGAALDAAREALTGQASEYDPVMRRYAELVLDRTGKELAADENEPYLAFATPEAQALYDRAKREVLTAGAAGNLASVASPVSLAARSAEGEAIRAAKANVPYSADLIARMSPDLALTMQAVNARYLASVPATRAYRGASASAREELLLGDIADRSPLNYLLDAPTRRQLTEAQRREIRRTQPR